MAVVRNIVNVAMSGLNLSSVGLVMLLYLYLSVQFSVSGDLVEILEIKLFIELMLIQKIIPFITGLPL